jgi:hypothetical protein
VSRTGIQQQAWWRFGGVRSRTIEGLTYRLSRLEHVAGHAR